MVLRLVSIMERGVRVNYLSTEFETRPLCLSLISQSRNEIEYIFQSTLGRAR